MPNGERAYDETIRGLSFNFISIDECYSFERLSTIDQRRAYRANGITGGEHGESLGGR